MHGTLPACHKQYCTPKAVCCINKKPASTGSCSSSWHIGWAPAPACADAAAAAYAGEEKVRTWNAIEVTLCFPVLWTGCWSSPSAKLSLKHYLLFCKEDLKDCSHPTAEVCFAVAKKGPVFIPGQGRTQEQGSPDPKVWAKEKSVNEQEDINYPTMNTAKTERRYFPCMCEFQRQGLSYGHSPAPSQTAESVLV